MKKLSFLLSAAIILFAASCNQSTTESENNNGNVQNEEEQNRPDNMPSEDNTSQNNTVDKLTMRTYSPDMAAQVDYKGEVVHGEAWEDANGKNFVIFTEIFDEEKAEIDGVKDKFLYAYHFADKGNGYEELRMIQDWEKECDLSNDAEFRFHTLNITDLDNDNKAEITFIYRLGCTSDATPVPMKLMMLEDGDKYAIRGNTSLKRYNHEGEMNVDASFNDAPDEFLPFAKGIWESDREYFNKFNE